MPNWKWKVGQCYRITAFEGGYIYRVIVRSVYSSDRIAGDFKAFCDVKRRYYDEYSSNGMFTNITKKRKITL